MSPEAQRIAIATELGYQGPFGIAKDGQVWGKTHPESSSLREWVPDYPTDLNAMHGAWKAMPWDMQVAFSYKLHEVCGSNQLNHVVNATAAQRAEAFLRTLNLWTDSP